MASILLALSSNKKSVSSIERSETFWVTQFFKSLTWSPFYQVEQHNLGQTQSLLPIDQYKCYEKQDAPCQEVFRRYFHLNWFSDFQSFLMFLKFEDKRILTPF